LCVTFILGLAWFILHVSDAEQDLGTTVLSLRGSLMPCFVFTAVLIVAWRWEWVGALLFSAFALYYGAENLRQPRWILSVSAPLLTVGLLFLLSWLAEARMVHQQDATREFPTRK
jgi:hypothetical protein